MPTTLKTLKLIHEDFGLLEWSKIVNYVIEFSKRGFIPSPRLINALQKEKFLFKINNDSIYQKIISHPKKRFFNPEYTNTLKTISKNFSDFYNGNIARKIIKTVNESSNPGFFDISDFQTYEAKNKKLCAINWQMD